MSVVRADFMTAILTDEPLAATVRTIADMRDLFRDEQKRLEMDPRTVVYRVQSFLPVPEETEGGLFFGATFVEPGRVGDEYFMTKGHFHARPNRAEYHATVAGHGGVDSHGRRPVHLARADVAGVGSLHSGAHRAPRCKYWKFRAVGGAPRNVAARFDISVSGSPGPPKLT